MVTVRDRFGNLSSAAPGYSTRFGEQRVSAVPPSPVGTRGSRGSVSRTGEATKGSTAYYESKYGKVPKGSAYRPGIQYFSDEEFAAVQEQEATQATGRVTPKPTPSVFTSGSKQGDVYVDSKGNVIQYLGQGEQRRVGIVGETTTKGQTVKSLGGRVLGFIKSEPKTVEVRVGQTLPSGGRIDVLGQEVTSGGVRYVATEPQTDLPTTTPSVSKKVVNIVWRNIKTGIERLSPINESPGQDYVKTTKKTIKKSTITVAPREQYGEITTDVTPTTATVTSKFTQESFLPAIIPYLSPSYAPSNVQEAEKLRQERLYSAQLREAGFQDVSTKRTGSDVVFTAVQTAPAGSFFEGTGTTKEKLTAAVVPPIVTTTTVKEKKPRKADTAFYQPTGTGLTPSKGTRTDIVPTFGLTQTLSFEPKTRFVEAPSMKTPAQRQAAKELAEFTFFQELGVSPTEKKIIKEGQSLGTEFRESGFGQGLQYVSEYSKEQAEIAKTLPILGFPAGLFAGSVGATAEFLGTVPEQLYTGGKGLLASPLTIPLVIGTGILATGTGLVRGLTTRPAETILESAPSIALFGALEKPISKLTTSRKTGVELETVLFEEKGSLIQVGEKVYSFPRAGTKSAVGTGIETFTKSQAELLNILKFGGKEQPAVAATGVTVFDLKTGLAKPKALVRVKTPKDWLGRSKVLSEVPVFEEFSFVKAAREAGVKGTEVTDLISLQRVKEPVALPKDFGIDYSAVDLRTYQYLPSATKRAVAKIKKEAVSKPITSRKALQKDFPFYETPEIGGYFPLEQYRIPKGIRKTTGGEPSLQYVIGEPGSVRQPYPFGFIRRGKPVKLAEFHTHPGAYSPGPSPQDVMISGGLPPIPGGTAKGLARLRRLGLTEPVIARDFIFGEVGVTGIKSYLDGTFWIEKRYPSYQAFLKDISEPRVGITAPPLKSSDLFGGKQIIRESGLMVGGGKLRTGARYLYAVAELPIGKRLGKQLATSPFAEAFPQQVRFAIESVRKDGKRITKSRGEMLQLAQKKPVVRPFREGTTFFETPVEGAGDVSFKSLTAVQQKQVQVGLVASRDVVLGKAMALYERGIAETVRAKSLQAGAVKGLALSLKGIQKDTQRGVSGIRQQPREFPILKSRPTTRAREVIITRELPRTIPRQPIRVVPVDVGISRSVVRSIPRDVVREVPRTILRELPRTVPREVPRLRIVERGIQREIERQVPKEITREVPLEITATPTPPPPIILVPPFGNGVDKKKKKKRFKKKKRKKKYTDFFMPIADLASKTRAEVLTRRPATQAKPSVRLKAFSKSFGLRVPVAKQVKRKRRRSLRLA